MSDELKLRILRSAREYISKFGVKGFTMDELASSISISKKTLYTVFIDKKDLIDQVLMSIYDETENCLKQIREKAQDPISELMDIEDFLSETMSKMDISVMNNFKKAYPELFQKIRERDTEVHLELIKDNLRRGIRDGLFRADLDIDFIANLNFYSTRGLVDSGLYHNSIEELIKIKREYTIYHLRGIATYKGLSFIESKLTD